MNTILPMVKKSTQEKSEKVVVHTVNEMCVSLIVAPTRIGIAVGIHILEKQFITEIHNGFIKQFEMFNETLLLPKL